MTTKPSTSTKTERKAFVAGEYGIFIDEQLGHGQFSKVFLATRVSSPAPRGKEEFAAKYVELRDAATRDRFNEEANVLVRINEKFNSPYVIRLIKRFMTRPATENSVQKGILIFENCRGPQLHQVLLRRGSPLPMPITQRFFAQMVDALACTHSCDVAHRDVKPGNFLLTSSDVEKAHVVLIDFGFAVRGLGREPCGSPMFMAPEVMLGNLHGPPADIFALGVTLLCMIFGLNRAGGGDKLQQQRQQTGSSHTSNASNSTVTPSVSASKQIAAAAAAVVVGVSDDNDDEEVTDDNAILACFNKDRPVQRTDFTPQFVRSVIDESSPYFQIRYVLEACLETDPRRRPTAQQLRHVPWVKEAGVEQSRKAGRESSSVTSSVAAFAAPQQQTAAPPQQPEQQQQDKPTEQQKQPQEKPVDRQEPQPQQQADNKNNSKDSRNHQTDTVAALREQGVVLPDAVLAISGSDVFVAPPSRQNSKLLLPQQTQQQQSQQQQQQQSGATFDSKESSVAKFSSGMFSPLTPGLSSTIAAAATRSESPTNANTAEMDGSLDERVRALLACASAHLVPGNRAVICARVSKLLCEKANESVAAHDEAAAKNKENDNSNSAKTATAATTGTSDKINPMLVEQLHWMSAQLSSMVNVLSQHEPLPEIDAVLAVAVKAMAASALRARLIRQKECPYGPCDIVLLHCRVVLKNELGNYRELDVLRKRLESFATGK